MNFSEYISQHESQFIETFKEFLRFPSISSLKEHKDDMLNTAEFLNQTMVDIGLKNTRLISTGKNPVVYGEWKADAAKTTILIYGHYDVQPVDPLHLWKSPPFEPRLENDRIYARGASDNKGNIFLVLCALKTLIANNLLGNVNVKIMIEGQEEIFSPYIADFLNHHKELLACDYVLNSDTSQYSETTPSISLSLRGLCALQVDVKGAVGDLHSGQHGGLAPNPIDFLCRIAGLLKNPEGQVLVDGFYDDVLSVDEELTREIAKIPFNEGEYKQKFGVRKLGGEPEFLPMIRNWFRPTLEFNGIWGGFQGEGAKTVLPAEAHAKISCRLVPNQDPAKIAAQVSEFIRKNSPEPVSVRVNVFGEGAFPYFISKEHPGNHIAAKVLREIYGKEPFYLGAGVSIPIAALFKRELGVYSVGLGFGLEDENLHAPNEFFRLSSFRKGMIAYCKFLTSVE